MARRRIILFCVAGFIVVVLVSNLIFGLLSAEAERINDIDCIVALRRISTALVDYALRNDGEFPNSLDSLNKDFGYASLLLRCPITGVEYTYLPIISLDAPSEVPFLWCGAEHGSERTRVDGRSCLVVLSQMQVIRQCEFNPAVLRMLIRPYLDALQKSPDERVLALSGIVSDTSVPLWLRRLAVWRIGKERRSDVVALLEPFLKNRLLRFEVAVALAECDSKRGVDILIRELKSSRYRRRWRAYNALLKLTEKMPDYSPEIMPERQEDSIDRWRRWLRRADD